MQYKSCYGVILLSLIHIMRSAVFAQISAPISTASLSGLTGFALSIGDLSPDVQGVGLKGPQLRADAESKLRTAGIRIIPAPVWVDTVGAAELYVEVNTLKLGTAQYSYCVQLDVIQKVSLSRNVTRETLGVTWSTSGMGVVGQSKIAGSIRDQVGVLLDQFVSHYQSANLPAEK